MGARSAHSTNVISGRRQRRSHGAVSAGRSTTAAWIPIAAIGIRGRIRGIIWASFTPSDVPPMAIVAILIAIIVYAGFPELLVHVDKDVRCEVKMCHIETIIK